MKYILLGALVFLGACAYTLPDGSKVHRDVCRMDQNRTLLEEAARAETEWETRNPLGKSATFCSEQRGSLEFVALCSLV
jgi:hypothetical protein